MVELNPNLKLHGDAARKFNESHGMTMAKSIIRPDGPLKVKPNELLTLGRILRDGKIWQYPILGEAILVFQQLAASREWAVSGKALATSRAVEFINNAQTVNVQTGYVEYGFEQYLRRRVMDYLILGRTAFTVRPKTAGKPPVLEYLDPALLKFGREKMMLGSRNEIAPVTPTEVVWQYANRRKFRSNEVVVNHPFPIGTDLFISSVVNLLPVATLAWLQREHDTQVLDGRKMRDVLLVGSHSIQSAIESAVEMTIALHAGADPREVGVPVVEINNPLGKPIEDQIGRLGLSSIPDAFSREEFTFTYVNEIAAALGLALRHFWNNEKTTNRALEVVQEQRQQQKGPSTFVRSEQRLLNSSGFLQQFDKSGNGVRFAFREETDMSSVTAKADAMVKMTSALKQIASVFGTAVDMESWLSWMQSEGVVPPEMRLLNSDNSTVMEDSGDSMNEEGEITELGDPEPTTMPDVKTLEKKLEHGEVVMDGNGYILAHRQKIYRFSKVIKSALHDSWASDIPRLEEAEAKSAAADLFSKAVAEAKMDRLAEKLKIVYAKSDGSLDAWKKTLKDDKKSLKIDETVDLCLRNIVLPVRLYGTLEEIVEGVQA